MLSFHTSVLYYSVNVLEKLVLLDEATAFYTLTFVLKRLPSSDHHNSPSQSSISLDEVLNRVFKYFPSVFICETKVFGLLSSFWQGLNIRFRPCANALFIVGVWSGDLEQERIDGLRTNLWKVTDALTWRSWLQRLKCKQQLVYRFSWDMCPGCFLISCQSRTELWEWGGVVIGRT